MRTATPLPQWVALTFSPEGTIASISQSVEPLTGYSASELVGKPLVQLLAERSALEIPKMMESAKEWGSWDGEIVYRHRRGGILEGRASLSLLTGHRDTAVGYSLVTLLGLGAATPEGWDGDALAQVGAKLRTLAHEMNNPLAVIMGFAQLVMLNVNCNGKIRADMEKLYSEVRRVSEVVERLHAYALALHKDEQIAVQKGSS